METDISFISFLKNLIYSIDFDFFALDAEPTGVRPVSLLLLRLSLS